MQVVELSLSKIIPDPDQPRKEFDPEALKELAESIRRYGLLSPILVRYDGENYIIIAGERRYRALLLNGAKTVPALVHTEDDFREVSLIENLQREDLNPIEEARALKVLMEEKSYRQEDLASIIGKSRSYVANSIRLLKLDERTTQAVLKEEISEAHGRSLAGIRDEEERQKLLQLILDNKLSVRSTETLVKKHKKKQAVWEDVFLRRALEEAENRLDTKVELQGDERRGRLVIEYYGKEELERILELLTGQ
ncbi:MAG: ParB/RepB/Spo0J family partition protein [Filifactor alocis]|nr:ParB/RepB/Spo0J family partition protein [Filifactor alocis]